MTYDDVRERFVKDVADHEMLKLHDDGLYRRVRFRKPTGGWQYWFDLITWPGNLVINGDMGTYMFARVEDMFGFFEGDREINPGYWGEKLRAHSGYREYSQQRARRLVEESFQQSRDYLREPDPVWLEITHEVLTDDVLSSEHELNVAVRDFNHMGFQFHDWWEWDLSDFTFQYLWCCLAIKWGIAKYREVPCGG